MTLALQQWSCDVCGEPVSVDASSGLVVWRDRPTDTVIEYYDFKIVHKTILDDPEPRRCDPGDAAGFMSNLELMHFVGPDGLAMLLSWLSSGPLKGGGYPRIAVADLDQFVDFVRRVQTPYYEEARSSIGDERTHHWLGDANEHYPYLPDTLRRIADDTVGA